MVGKIWEDEWEYENFTCFVGDPLAVLFVVCQLAYGIHVSWFYPYVSKCEAYDWDKYDCDGYEDESSSDENEMSEEEDDIDNSKEGLSDVSESDDGNYRSSDE